MQIGIVGAGAVGGLLGALFARAGHAVSFVARGETLDALRSRGVVVDGPDGVYTAGPFEASADPRDLKPVELLFVAVKAWQVRALAPSLVPLVGAGGLVVPLQNGVEAAGHLARALGDAPVVGGLCHVIASREGPARVRTVGSRILVTMGERARGGSERLDRIADAMRAAGMAVKLSSDIGADLWTKLMFVESLGSVGAVTRASIDVVRAIPETRALLEQAMREVQAVAAGQGVTVSDAALAESLARIDSMPAGATSSMHRNLVEGRRSELEEQTGAVVRLGVEGGVPRPLHDFLWASLLPQHRRALES